jgi:hypothetical protein
MRRFLRPNLRRPLPDFFVPKFGDSAWKWGCGVAGQGAHAPDPDLGEPRILASRVRGSQDLMPTYLRCCRAA